MLLTNGLLIYSVDQIPHLGWHHPTVLTGLGLAAAACATLIFVERKARTPMLLLSLFRSRLFTAGMSSLFLVAFSQVALNFLMPFYLQNLRGFSASQVGWIIVADSVIIMAMAQTAPHKANVQSMPMAAPAVPMITLPSDQSPRSIKNKLSTRPSKFGGVAV